MVGLLLAGALVAPAGAAADATFANQCQYSYDRYWRPVPMIFGGTLDAPAAVGDTVRLRDGTVSAILPSWLTTFAYESGMIPAGDGSLPVRAWLALEATNTAEGVRAPIALDTVANTHVVLTPQGIVDEERSSISVDDAPIPEQTWTATGGEVVVRQALGESLPALPVGRDGALVRVRGSLYVEATLTFQSGDVLRLYLDCLQGDQVDQGASHTDALPGSLGVFAVPGWTGSSVPGPVDADLLTGVGPPRAGAGEQATLRGSVLRVRLTDAQRAAWFGGSSSAVIAGSVDVFGARSVEGAQTLPVSGTASGATFSLPLPDSVWTAAGAEGIDIAGGREIVLDATAGGVTRRLVLTRISSVDPYPFARVLRAAAPPTPLPTPTPVPTAVVPVVTTPPIVVAKPAAPKVTVRSTRLKVSGTRVPVAVACASAACRGTLVLKTTSGRVLTKTARYSLAAGKRATVKLTVSSAGRKYLKSHKRVKTRLAVRVTGAAASSKRLTLTR